MKTKLLVPAIFFIILSLLISIGNVYYAIAGKWGIWSFPFWAAVLVHGLTMIVGLYLLTGICKKEEK